MPMPRYTSSGIGIASMPSITTAGYQEQARSAQTLAAAMDRVTNFALKRMEMEAKIEGEEYGALNAPTKEQLDAAAAAGQDVSELVPGDKSTVFGRAARASALDSIVTTMTVGARQEISSLRAKYTNQEISADQFQSSLESLVSAQTEVMQAVSPLAARSFSASISTTSNSAYLSVMEEQARRDKLDLEVSMRAGIENDLDSIEDMILKGPTVDPSTGQLIPPEEAIMATLGKDIEMAAMMIDDPAFFQTSMDALQKRISEAKVTVITRAAQENPYKMMDGLATGKFGDKKVQYTYDTMTAEEKQVAFASIQDEMSRRFAFEAASDARIERLRTQRSNDLQASIVKARLDNDNEAIDSLLSQLQLVDPAAYASSAIAITTQPGFDDPDAIRGLQVLSLNNDLTYEAVNNVFSSGRMTLQTFKTFTNDLEAQRDQKVTTAIEWLRNERNVPERTLLNYDIKQNKAIREVNTIKNKLIEARIKDPSIDPLEFVQNEVKVLIQEEGQAAETAMRDAAMTAMAKVAQRMGVDVNSLTADQAEQWLKANPGAFGPGEYKYTTETLLPVYRSMEQ